MIGNVVVDKDGLPVDGQGTKLSESAYQPPQKVMEVFAKCQTDYQRAFSLQHRPFEEFDGLSLLQRTKLDQQTFAAYVGADYVPEHKRWRWRGRKNTARNKIIKILAYMVSGILFPNVTASDDDDKPDKLAARIMRLLVEERLQKAGYEMKFMYMVTSALVNPAVIVQVEYFEAIQRIRTKLANGTIKMEEAIDEFLSGVQLNIEPIDQYMLGDMYVNDIQQQPYTIRLRRMSYDTARKIYSGRYFYDVNGEKKDAFDFVQAGKTRVFISGNDRQTMFDIEWTEGDRYAVQVATFYYRPDDLELTFVGGVFMGDYNEPYTERFTHRRQSLINNEWKSIPVYDVAKSYYEPIDPAGRFAYGKSAAFKEYWDDDSVNRMYRLIQDGTTLEVIKPLFISGVSKVDSIVIAPGAVTGMPSGAEVNPWSMAPALPSALQVLQKNEADMADSTTINPTPTTPQANVPATQTAAAVAQASKQLTLCALMIADLVRQVGELTVDCIVQHVVIGELDATLPESLSMKYHTLLVSKKENGKTKTHRISFKSNLVGKKMTPNQQTKYAFKLWKDAGEDGVIHHVNPYKFARMMYKVMVDADDIVNHALGTDRQQQLLKYQMLTQPFVYPFTDQKAVAEDVIDEYAEGDPDKYKKKGNAGSVNGMMNAVMGGGAKPPEAPNVSSPLSTGAKPSPMAAGVMGGMM